VSRRLSILIAGLALTLAGAAPAGAALSAPTGLGVADLVTGDAVFDPQFTWAPVTGARGYQVEVNSTDFWAPGSKVCCDNISPTVPLTTFGVSFSPPVVLANDDEYFWRVRAVDANNVAGPWAAGPSFEKGFGTVPTVPGLRLADLDLSELPAGSSVATPIILWNPSPGASSYRVDVTLYSSGSCDWSASVWEKKTTVTAWTPLGWNRASGADPLSRGITPSDDLLSALSAGAHYCVRVAPIDGASVATGGPQVEADWTYLPSINSPAFQWSGPPPVEPCGSPCAPAASDYLRPLAGSTVGKMPVFTWNPVPGAQSYFVVVANDPFFTTIEDYAYTRVTAYAPRKLSQTRGYPDKTSNYYWSVLPATETNGLGVSIDPVSSNPQAFAKQATPPTLLGPSGGAVLSTAATVFHWTPVFEARRYRLQVSEDSSFANVIQEQSALVVGAVTDSTAYTSSTNYPTGKTLYWRVQAELEDENSKFVGLRWSATGTFQRTAGAGGGGGGGADQRFKVTAQGYPSYRKWKSVTLTVKNLATNAPIANAAVRVSGAGVDPKTKRTGSLGKVTFRIKAKRYPGTVTYRITKSGFKTLYYKQSVRRF
jgi:hypothetical protein